MKDVKRQKIFWDDGCETIKRFHEVDAVLASDYGRLAQECDSVAGKLRTALLDKAQIEAEREAALKQVDGLQQDQDLYRQWFNAVQDLNPIYLEQADYQAAVRLMERLGIRVPISVMAGARKAKP